MRKTKENAGITLIALVITIIVLLILAGISIITLTGQNGILTQANKAKQENELGEEKEKAGLVSQELKIEKAQGKEVDKTGFQKMVDSQFGVSKATGDVEDSTYVIVVAKTGNIYLINEDGTIDEAGNKNDMKKDENPGDLEALGNNIYAVNSIEDLVALSYTVNSGTDTYEGKTVTLGRSLYFNGMFDSYANPDSKYEVKTNEDSAEIGYAPNENATTTIKELVTTGSGFMPIGANSNGFKGNFDGKNNHIDGLYETFSLAGLFGTVNGTVKISNLGIKSGSLSAEGIVGGIVVISQGDLVIENCYNGSELKSQYLGGGIVGTSYSNLKIINSYNKGMVTCGTTGGLIGVANQSGMISVEKSYNTGSIKTINNNIAGGIIGSTQVTTNVNECYNVGNVQEAAIAGGIIGKSNPGKAVIDNCYNTGNISGNDAAGLMGWYGQIKNSYNKGDITSNQGRAGGIVAAQAEKIEKSFNEGKITGGSELGGIVGDTSNEIVDSYNTGELVPLKETTKAGGIAAKGQNITNCYNTSSISGENLGNVSGIIGDGNRQRN